MAVNDVNFSVAAGQIHGLLGENGAGKTTLMNVLAGTFEQDSGEILIDGNIVTHMTPSKASSLKIRFIHQELNLCNDLTVYQNMYLGEEIRNKYGFVDKNEEIKRAQEVLVSLHTNIKATDLVEDLETSQKQLVEIARALLFKSELIIMDEPTTSLNNTEIENLFSIMKKFQSKGVSFIYISHKMPELFAICDHYTVLRDGKFIANGLFKDISQHEITELLVGGALIDVHLKEIYKPIETDEIFLDVKNLSGKHFSDISFQLKKGEILVITGLQGSGAGDLALTLFGIEQASSGTISNKDGIIEKPSIKKMMKNGIGMIPKNRKERGIIADLSIRNNMSLAYFTAKHKALFIKNSQEEERFNRRREQMAIKVNSSSDYITALSGGNQQKVVIGRWLELDSDVYVMDNPTQGIDVGAKFEIYKLINEIAQTGKSIIVFTSEFPEIFQLADRTMVLYKGQVKGILNKDNLTESNVMALSTGLSLEKK